MKIANEVSLSHYRVGEANLKDAPLSVGRAAYALNGWPGALPRQARLMPLWVRHEEVAVALWPRARPGNADVAQRPSLALGCCDELRHVVCLSIHSLNVCSSSSGEARPLPHSGHSRTTAPGRQMTLAIENQGQYRLAMPSRLLRVLTLALVTSIAATGAEAFWIPWSIVDRKIDSVRLGFFPAIVSALDSYRKEHGSYPDSLGQLPLDHLPADPWGTAYIYEHSGPNQYLLRSAGANAIDEHGEGDDITTWPKHYDCRTYGVNCSPDLFDIARLVPLVTALASAAALAGLGAIAARRWLARRSS